MVAKVHFFDVEPSRIYSDRASNAVEAWSLDVFGPITERFLSASVQAKLNCDFEEFKFPYNQRTLEGRVLTSTGNEIGRFTIVEGVIH